MLARFTFSVIREKKYGEKKKMDLQGSLMQI